jgi:hypothetical protein
MDYVLIVFPNLVVCNFKLLNDKWNRKSGMETNKTKLNRLTMNASQFHNAEQPFLLPIVENSCVVKTIDTHIPTVHANARLISSNQSKNAISVRIFLFKSRKYMHQKQRVCV